MNLVVLLAGTGNTIYKCKQNKELPFHVLCYAFHVKMALTVKFCLVNSTIHSEPAPASFIFKVQFPICVVALHTMQKLYLLSCLFFKNRNAIIHYDILLFMSITIYLLRLVVYLLVY
jgi:hypothetical protein